MLSALFRKDLIYSGISFGCKFVANLVVFSLLARILAVPDFGQVAFLIVVLSAVQTVLDFGHRMIVVRDITQRMTTVSATYLGSKVGLKLALFIPIFCTMIGYFVLNGFWSFPPWVLVLFIFSSLMTSLANLVFAVFHSQNRFEYEAIAQAVMAMVLLVGVGLTYWLNSASAFLGSYLVASLGMFLTSMHLLRAKFAVDPIEFLTSWSWQSIPREFKYAASFALITIADVFFASFDSIYIERYGTVEELGVYQGILKVIAGITVLAVVIVSVSLPIVSRQFALKTRRGLEKIGLLFLLASGTGLLVFLAYFSFNREIVMLILGSKYLEITEWDFHLGLYALSRYVRIIPAVYFVISGFQHLRLFIVCTLLAVAIIYFQTNVPTRGIKYAFRTITWCNVALAAAYSLAFWGLLGLRWKGVLRGAS